MKLSVLAISHHTADVEGREAFALGREEVSRLLRRLRERAVVDEALVLSTCNRTELIFAWSAEADFAGYFCGLIGEIKGAAAPPPAEKLARFDDADAVRRLFRVAAGLESQILGESQILAQVKAAYHAALRERTAGFLLTRLLHSAFRAGKRVRSETFLGRGAGGVGQAAAALAAEVFTPLAGRTVLLIGAGDAAETAARALIDRGADRLIVANRTLQRARRVAEALQKGAAQAECRPSMHHRRRNLSASASTPAPKPKPRAEILARAVDLASLPTAAAEADLIVSSTDSPEPVLTAGAFSAAAGVADSGPKVMIDIAVPRDIDPALGERPGVRLYNLNDLTDLVAANLERRRAEAPRAEAVVDEEVGRFERWLASRKAAPTIRLLRERLDALREAELKRYGGRFPAEMREQVDRFTRSLLGKLLHSPIQHLHETARDGDTAESMRAADLVSVLFDLDGSEPRR